MAEIYFLPVALDAASSSRNWEALWQHFEAGHDLGDRSHHISMLRTSLENAHRNLRNQIEAVRALPAMPGLETESLFQSIEAWADALATSIAVLEARIAHT